MKRALPGLLLLAVVLGGCASTQQHHHAVASISGSHGMVQASNTMIQQRPVETWDDSHVRTAEAPEQRVARGVPTPQPAREPVLQNFPTPQPPLPNPNIGSFTPSSRGRE